MSDVLVLVPEKIEALSAFWYTSISIPIKKAPESSTDACSKPTIVLGASNAKAVLSMEG